MSEQVSSHQQSAASHTNSVNNVNNDTNNSNNFKNNSNASNPPFQQKRMEQQIVGRVREKNVVEQGLVPKKIKRITFGIHSAEDMRKMSHFQVVHHEMYQMPSKKPVPYSVLDPRLGTSQKSQDCETCGLPLKDCVGHFAYVKFELPIFHIGYFKGTLDILQRICKSCSKILIAEDDRLRYLKIFRNPNTEVLKRKYYEKEIHERCKKTVICPHCFAINGTVKKITVLKISHEKYKTTKARDLVETLTEQYLSTFENAVDHNKDMKPYLAKIQEDLHPLKVYNIFQKIREDDVQLLNMDSKVSRPEDLLLTHILVPPICIRPSIPSDSGSNEDDMTVLMSKITQQNDIIKQNIEKGMPIESLMESWDYLQLLVAFYMNSELPGVPQHMLPSTKPTRSICQRLKGKYGRFRGNLSGKRVDFSGRTVISPDPNIPVDNVVVPILVAKVLTFPERVNDYNRKRLQRAVLNGPDKYPGANFVQLANTEGGLGSVVPALEDKRLLKYANREKISKELKNGDIVERHLIDGDMVLFNRQPSLHRLSIQCHKAKVLPYRTFRFNECCCAPYNADFDGDEMNLHLPQTEEAKAEAFGLMSVLTNLITPKNGEPIISCTQDFLTGSYLMTRRNMFFDRAHFCMLMSYMGISDAKIDLPPPAIWKPVELWTGKQLFSLLFKPNKQTDVYINLETKAKNYTHGEHFCVMDGYVCFQKGYFVSGNLDKKTIGDGTKTSSIFYFIIRNYGAAYAAECMGRVARVTSRWLMNFGCSIGISDVEPSDKLTKLKEKLLLNGYEVCNKVIEQFNQGKLEPQPGCDAEQTLEAILNRELSQIRGDAGNICLKELHWQNSPLTMALCGSKGSPINISQMIACVGQQTINGSRIAYGFINRTLPHFKHFSRTPAAKGFVSNSFYTGLTPTEFFFHTMAGREGLVDTAVKTAETGYMQRRLMKALEDLAIQYDNTVRNSVGTIVQFKYGDDGLDPYFMEYENGRPVNLKFAFNHIKFTTPVTEDDEDLTSDQIYQIIKEEMQKEAEFYSDAFKAEVDELIAGVCDKLDNMKRLIQEKQQESNDANTVEAWGNVLKKTCFNKVTQKQLRRFLDLLRVKYEKSMAEPGQTVGAIAGQSIGEPGTQMTLKTFHFAGVASMNVTLGVPRIVEIINATKNISTPIITAALVSDQDEKAARITKGRIEKTTLGQVAKHIREVYDECVCYLEVKLDKKIINALQLDISLSDVKERILATPKIGLKDQLVRIDLNKLLIYPPKNQREFMYHSIQSLKRAIPNVIVSGIPTVSRAVVSKNQAKAYELLVEGTNLRAVMGTPGIKGAETKSNNILEVEETLGIEAARAKIIDEIQYTMSSYGMSIDGRHMKLLADVMTFKGEILGITRFGISKMKDSVLMLASFERTTDHLFDASVHTRTDDIEGVSECIIMGVPVGVGTGLFKEVHNTESSYPKNRNALDASLTITGKKPLLSRSTLKPHQKGASAATALHYF